MRSLAHGRSEGPAAPGNPWPSRISCLALGTSPFLTHEMGTVVVSRGLTRGFLFQSRTENTLLTCCSTSTSGPSCLLPPGMA